MLPFTEYVTVVLRGSSRSFQPRHLHLMRHLYAARVPLDVVLQSLRDWEDQPFEAIVDWLINVELRGGLHGKAPSQEKVR